MMAPFVPLAEHNNVSADYQRAKELRQLSSPAEQILWNALRRLPKGECPKIRRQHPLSPYTVDFVCLKAKLVIEVDGFSHDARIAEDKQRDCYLSSLGYEILRFSNDDVRKNADGIALYILERIQEKIHALDVPLP
jgi:very-short-patch-repair endonuclease